MRFPVPFRSGQRVPVDSSDCPFLQIVMAVIPGKTPPLKPMTPRADKNSSRTALIPQPVSAVIESPLPYEPEITRSRSPKRPYLSSALHKSGWTIRKCGDLADAVTDAFALNKYVRKIFRGTLIASPEYYR